jgi:hypothetical protein
LILLNWEKRTLIDDSELTAKKPVRSLTVPRSLLRPSDLLECLNGGTRIPTRRKCAVKPVLILSKESSPVSASATEQWHARADAPTGRTFTVAPNRAPKRSTSWVHVETCVSAAGSDAEATFHPPYVSRSEERSGAGERRASRWQNDSSLSRLIAYALFT